MTDLEKAARMALEFCEFCWRDVPMNDYAFERLEKIITALRERLAPCRYADMCNEEGECTDGCAALRQALSNSVEQPAQPQEWRGPVDWEEVAADYAKTIAMMKGAQEAAVLAEREACAKVADLVAREIDDTNGTASYVAAAIRARGQA